MGLLIQEHGVGNPVDAVSDVGGDFGGRTTGGNGVHDLVGDQRAHLLPAALLGHRVELGLQILPAVRGQHRPIRRSGPVERQQPPGARDCLLVAG